MDTIFTSLNTIELELKKEKYTKKTRHCALKKMNVLFCMNEIKREKLCYAYVVKNRVLVVNAGYTCWYG